ncbi:MAG TPA: tetratricopeptide repeat protein, partial [Acidobacteriaceae bacterium]|nr:tetratricopeptide repeat protein [Acidobacteriaceae bacterium]
MYSFAPSQYLRRLLPLAALLIWGATGVSAAAGGAAPMAAERSQVERSIRQDLSNGHANDAVALLQQQLSADSANAADHNFLCRVYIQEELWTDAQQECIRAVALEPNNSLYHQWLGRAYGDTAAHASLSSAYSLARKAHAEFEIAVRLDPTNQSALSDLGEYLIDVPRILGGGPVHAKVIAQQLQPLSAARYHALQAKIDAKKSNDAGAEQQWKLAVQSSSYPADEWMGLAEFYADQKDFPAMRQAIQSGIAADPGNGPALVAGATLLIEKHQDPTLAEQMLRRYLGSHQQSEDAPAFQVQV